MRKIFVLVVAVLLMTSGAVLFAAGQSEGTGESDGENAALAAVGFNKAGLPITTQKSTLTVVASPPSVTTKPLADFPKVQWLEELSNVHIDWITMPGGAERTQKVNLMFASGDLPDVFLKGAINNAQKQTFIADGLIMELSDLIDTYAPNVTKVFTMYPASRFAASEIDGGIYSLPQFKPWDSEFWLPYPVFFVNKEWLDKLGMEMPKTHEEFYRMLKAFKEQDPNGNGEADEVPFVGRFEDLNSLAYLFNPFGVTTQMGGWMVENGKVYQSYVSDGFKEALIWVNKMFQEGFLNQDLLTMQQNELLSISRQEPRVVGVTSGWGLVNIVGDPVYLSGEYVHLPPVKGPSGEALACARIDQNATGGGAYLPTTIEVPELAMRWLDLVYDEKVNLELSWGPITWTSETTFKMNDIPEGQQAAAYRNNTVTPKNIWPVDYIADKYKVVDPPLGIIERTAYGQLCMDAFPEENMPSTLIQMTVEEGKLVQQYSPDIDSFLDSKISEFIYKGGVEAAWDEYVATLEKMGLSKIQEVQQKVYDRFKEGMGGSTAVSK
jgi:putative aldouronate transport system substrate-binding protein